MKKQLLKLHHFFRASDFSEIKVADLNSPFEDEDTEVERGQRLLQAQLEADETRCPDLLHGP
jgi:hypothetical protein